MYDTRTKLTWQQAVDANTYTQSAAASYCTILSLAGTGWRLPTEEELLTLADPTKVNPAIDLTAFPNTPATQFWSSTPNVSASNSAWWVFFGVGFAGFDATSTSYRVRCVR